MSPQSITVTCALLLIHNADGLVQSSVKTHKHLAGAAKLLRRQTPANIDNQQTGTSYTIDLAIGTPSQSLSLIIDTGSAHLWVNPTCETTSQLDFCESFPQFDYTTSSTINDTGYADLLSYGKGNVTIQYVTDVVTIGDAAIQDQLFGIGLESYDIPLGILGLSPPISDAETTYSFVLDSMVTQNLIASRAFSLDLRGVDNPDGAVIFGGIDTGKFIGALEKCPILDPSETPTGADRYWIYMTSLGMSLPSGESGLLGNDLGQPVFLDSGGTLTRLPAVMFQAIGEAFPGAQYDSESGFYLVDCSAGDEDGSVDFGFNGKVISVSFNDFIWEIPSANACVLGVLADDDEPVLGDSFLRAAYVVYDQDNRNLHLAQAANCGSKLVEIDSGSDAVPSTTGDCTGATERTLTAVLTQTVDTSGPTVTNTPGDLTSLLNPGPGATAQSTKASSSLCLTCTKTTAASASGTGASATGDAANMKITEGSVAVWAVIAVVALLI